MIEPTISSDEVARREGAAETTAPPPLLAFYDRLRRRLEAGARRRLGERASEILLLGPDLFVLLLRLTLDQEVPRATRGLIGGALIYFLVPTDLMPEALIGAGGFLDDVLVTAAVLAHVLATEAAPYIERHWSGSQGLGAVLNDALGAIDSLMSVRWRTRLAKTLARFGVDLEAVRRGASGSH